jgi:hypothetical protein
MPLPRLQRVGNVSDPFIDEQVNKLSPTPTQDLGSVAGQWQALDEYTAKKTYVVVYGSEQVPKFFSNRIDFGSAVLHPTYLNDWSTWQLK